MTQRTALITGASKGIGLATARAIAPDYELLLGGRDADALAGIAADLPAARPWPVDLTDDAALAHAVAGIDKLDALVHSAGTAHIAAIPDTPAPVWREIFEVNVVAVAELTRLVLPALRAANGHVVLINSGSGLRANPNWAPYAASKFALRAFADALREEEPAIRVTSVYPGRTDTPMQRTVRHMEGGDYQPDRYLRPESVANAVAGILNSPADAHPTDLTVRPKS